ncbi:MAG: hypothetical protein AABX97_09440, partial [Candidatus Thermoplasmatota archaeon]
MTSRAEKTGKALSLLIVVAMVAGGLFAIALALAPPAHAGTCDQVAPVINGNWVITTAQVCTGINYFIDGQLYIRNTGSLLLTNGGITFTQDTSHRGSLWIDGPGGSLILDNSMITSQTSTLSPYLKLQATVNGTLVMRDGAVLKFPGTLLVQSGASLNMTSSKITGFTDSEIQNLGDLSFRADNDDSAIITMNGATAYLYKSRIERIYENTLGGGLSKNITLVNSNFYAYDSYVGLDFSNNWQVHNVMTLDTTSRDYLYNVTIDAAQSALTPVYQQLPAFVPSGSGSAYILRWLAATVTDSFGSPVQGATIWSRMSPSATPAQYPETGNANPSPTTLWYLGRTDLTGAMPWNKTGAYGAALIPLWTDTITSASLPNAVSFGNYQENATYQTYKGGAGVSYAPYPNLTVANNYKPLTIALGSAIICPSTVTVWASQSFTGTVSLSGSLEIDGAVTITDGGIYFDQQANACSYLKIRSGASLTLVNSVIWSNYALPVDVLEGGALVTSRGSQLLLTQGGSPGLLRSDGTASTVSLIDTTVSGNV